MSHGPTPFVLVAEERNPVDATLERVTVVDVFWRERDALAAKAQLDKEWEGNESHRIHSVLRSSAREGDQS